MIRLVFSTGNNSDSLQNMVIVCEGREEAGSEVPKFNRNGREAKLGS